MDMEGRKGGRKDGDGGRDLTVLHKVKEEIQDVLQ
jgi:hypothetical protein